MVGKYPEIVKTRMPNFSSFDFGAFNYTDIFGLTSSRIVEAVISYLHYSQEYGIEIA